MSDSTNSDLSHAQIEHFIDHGYLKLTGAFDDELARLGRDQLWNAMAFRQMRRRLGSTRSSVSGS